MPHVRTTVRNAVVTALTGLPTCGSRVFKGRRHPLPKSKLPAYRIFTPTESATHENKRKPLINDTFITIVVQVCITGPAADDEEDVLDQACLEAQHAMVSPAGLANVVKWTEYVGYDENEDNENLDLLCGNLTFRAYLVVAENAVDTPL